MSPRAGARPRAVPSLILISVALAGTASAASPWKALPQDGLFELPVADTRSALSRLVFRPGPEGLLIDTGLGADFPLVRWTSGAWSVGTGLEAGVYMDFDAGGSLTFDLETFDGLFGLPIDVASGPWSARVAFSHISAHYGDGVRKDEVRPTNLDAYSREFVTVPGSRSLGPARVYAGGHALLHVYPKVPPLMFQVGGELAPAWRVAPYVAADLQLAQEFAWAPEIAGQAGAWVKDGRRRLRVAAVARYGHDDTGKLSLEVERYVGVLVGFDATGAL